MTVEWWHLVLLAATWFFAGLIWGEIFSKPLNHDHEFQDQYLPTDRGDERLRSSAGCDQVRRWRCLSGGYAENGEGL